MHIVFFADQHVGSFGGAQVSMRLQKAFLERAGHTVTAVGPRRHGSAARAATDSSFIDLPSVPITPDREYAASMPGRHIDRILDAALRRRPTVDVVHVQADFWGAVIGHRFAARRGIPVVHTMHNRVAVGVAATVPFPGVAMRALNAWQRRMLPGPAARAERGVDGWAYLRRLAVLSQAVTAPSGHFAARLQAHDVRPVVDAVARTRGDVDVVWNGIDDDILDRVRAAAPSARRPGRPRLVWLGRMSPEKRLLPFLDAVARSGVDAEVRVLGGGGQMRAARRLVAQRRPAASVVFVGRVPYVDSLAEIAAADAVVQTSIGFETQGMTVFEAAALGTPSVVCDPDIAAELRGGVWEVPAEEGVPVDALAETLRRAVADIAATAAPVPDAAVAAAFRQSSRTQAMIEIYRRVTA